MEHIFFAVLQIHNGYFLLSCEQLNSAEILCGMLSCLLTVRAHVQAHYSHWSNVAQRSAQCRQSPVPEIVAGGQ